MVGWGQKGGRSVIGGAGFTIVEVFVVIGLIGILAALTLQSSSGYRQRAYDARAVNDLGNAMAAEEAYYAAKRKYASVATVVGPANIAVPGFTVSEQVQMEITVDSESFRVTAKALLGSGAVFEYDSDTGAIVQR